MHLHNCFSSPIDLHAGWRPFLQLSSHHLESIHFPRPTFDASQKILSKNHNVAMIDQSFDFTYHVSRRNLFIKGNIK